MAREKKYQALARFFPKRPGTVNQAHQFVTGNSRDELVRAAQAALARHPLAAHLRLACLWASFDGPLIWAAEDGWQRGTEKYVP